MQATQQSRDGGIDHQAGTEFGMRAAMTWIMNVAVEVVIPCKDESKAVGVRYATVFMRSDSSLRTTHPEIMCTVDIVSGHLTSFLLNDCAQMLLPKLTVGFLFMTQEHALILAYGDKILG
ncbi:hypothetical protein KXD40_007293 [Peronospora effusa]|uniref:Uncharacterized protein n=1 Tax=Peronospora effusa TaxID=542832 RepID=A0A3R7W5D5_9STRA|nr:hypothetical protein DD237_004019 [Peronospora effusa]UIZ28759.1 hypothetical protein KXD40_007293 [Peronospora effusa]